MTRSRPNNPHRLRTGLLVLVLVILESAVFLQQGGCETFGIKDSRGSFVPKVSITVGNKDVTIKKLDPEEQFRSISVTLHPRNSALERNVGHLDIEWSDAHNKAGKPMPFAGPRYDKNLKKFQDSMQKSAVLKIMDKSNAKLFAGKSIADLFQIQIDNQVLVSSESVTEGEQTYQLGTGRDVSINVNRSAVTFAESNLRAGETIEVENRSGTDQEIGVELPERGVLFSTIRRIPGDEKIPKEKWERFPIAADSKIQVFLIPERDPARLLLLDGKEIVIKVFQGTRVRETRRIPVRVAADLKQPVREPGSGYGELPAAGQGARTGRQDLESSRQGETVQPGAQPQAATPVRASAPGGSLWIWLILTLILVMLGGLAAHAILFMLPRIQVLEDRLAKSEMFIHASREAIREELEQIKEEILGECQKDHESE